MNFSTPSKVYKTITAGDETEFVRATNRVKIQNMANGVPMPEEDAKRMGLSVNANWGELMTLLQHARLQYLNAFWGQQHFFKVRIPEYPPEQREDDQAWISERLNKCLRNSLEFFELHRSKWAAVASHGIGPCMWYSETKWRPKYVAIEDLRIATDTTLDFSNLGWFSVRHQYTPGELIKEAFASNSKWNKKEVAAILKNYKEINFDDPQNSYDWETTPEKLAEVAKQDGGFYSSDAMPKIPLWHFFFEDNEGWFMRVLPEKASIRGGQQSDKFLWRDDKPVASSWKKIIHVQYGDLCNKAPFNYHSIRSLGYALMEPCFYSNITRNRMIQHLHDQFNIWLTLNDPIDKTRPMFQEFGNLKVVKQGVNVVPQAQRHQVDATLIEMTMSQTKQLMQEVSQSYTQQSDTGTKKEQTAFETRVKIEQVNALMGGLLMTAFIYETQLYREICRRFCIPKSDDPDVQEFQKAWKERKMDPRWLNVKYWDVEAETPLGMGNPTIAQAASTQLMAERGAYPPEAQQEILHERALILTGDPRKAARWVPLGQNKVVSDGEAYAQSVFGTLMQGIPIRPRQGLSPIEQIDTLMPMLAGKIHQFEQRDNMASFEEATGLQTVAQFIGGLIEEMAQDPQQKERVKQYGDSLGQLTNLIKGLAQRGAEAKAKNNGNGDPTAMAKVQALMMTAGAKIHAKQLADAQKMAHKQQSFEADQHRKNAELAHKVRRGVIETDANLRNNRLKSLKE